MQPNNGLIFRVLKTPPAALGISPTARTVLLTLLDYWNPKRNGAEVFPGFERLAWQVGMSERALRDGIRSLELAELVKTKRRRNDSNRYIIQVAIIGRLCDDAPAFEPAKSAEPSGIGPAKSAEPNRQILPPNALPTPYDRLKAFPDQSQGQRQRSMPLMGYVAQNALRRKK